MLFSSVALSNYTKAKSQSNENPSSSELKESCASCYAIFIVLVIIDLMLLAWALTLAVKCVKHQKSLLVSVLHFVTAIFFPAIYIVIVSITKCDKEDKSSLSYCSFESIPSHDHSHHEEDFGYSYNYL
jgi:hypothetical protein